MAEKLSQNNDSDNDNNHNRNLYFRPLFFIVITINTTNIAIVLLFSFMNICEFFVCLVFFKRVPHAYLTVRELAT